MKRIQTGLKGTLNKDEQVFKVTSPRGDLGITVDEWKMPAFMGLTTWAAFRDGEKQESMVKHGHEGVIKRRIKSRRGDVFKGEPSAAIAVLRQRPRIRVSNWQREREASG